MADNQQYKRITDKVQLLVKRMEHLQKENERLRSQIKDASDKMTHQDQKVASLEQTVSVLKTVSSNLSQDDRKEMEKKLSHYLKEIDRCISMLSE